MGRLLDWLAGETTVSRFTLGCLLACAVGAIVVGVAETGDSGVIIVVVGVIAGALITSILRSR